jgi:hypothetical protein
MSAIMGIIEKDMKILIEKKVVESAVRHIELKIRMGE